ncbi:MAG: hypothetical protein V3V78_04530 [Candidatus Woesearchaeota archaeon]
MKIKMPMIVMMILMIASIIYAVQGVTMHTQVDDAEADFHAKQAAYFSLDKSTRDSAATGSDLNAQLVEIQQTPSELLRLKLVGVGKILTGIYILLFGILMALVMMPGRLGKVIKGK